MYRARHNSQLASFNEYPNVADTSYDVARLFIRLSSQDMLQSSFTLSKAQEDVPAQLGWAVQVDPMTPMLKAPGPKPLKLKCDKLLSTCAFRSNLRRFSWGVCRACCACTASAAATRQGAYEWAL